MSDTFLNDPLFQNLSPMKKAVITELLEKANNTSLDKAFPLLLKANATLTKNGEDFLEYANAFLEKYNDIVNFSHEKSNLYFSLASRMA